MVLGSNESPCGAAAQTKIPHTGTEMLGDVSCRDVCDYETNLS